MIYDAPDWAPPFGIRRPECPPDDAVTDAQCALAAAVEHAYLDLKLVGAGAGSDDGPGWTSPQLDGDGARASVSPVMGWSPGRLTSDRHPHNIAGPDPRAAVPGRARELARPGRTPIDDATPTPAASTTSGRALPGGKDAAPSAGAARGASGPVTHPGRPEARTPYSMWAAARI